MTTARGWAYTAVSVSAPFVALGFGDPTPMLVGFPFMVALVLGVVLDRPPDMGLVVELSATTGFEGTPVDVDLTVTASGRSAHVLLHLPAGVRIESVTGARRAGGSGLVVPIVDGVGAVRITLLPLRWGSLSMGLATVTVPGPLRIRLHRALLSTGATVAVMPSTEEVRLLVEPLVTNMHVGDLRSRARGPGFDLAELRPWNPGDPPRSINWRASLRSSETWVTERHAERSGDLVLVVDSVVEPGSDVSGVIEDVVRLAASLVKTYGAARHRVGLVSVAGHIRWFGLGSGRIHEHRLLEALMRTQTVSEPVWMAVDRILDRTIRPPSMTVLVTSFLDDGFVGRALRLARAGMDVVVIEVDPAGRVPPPATPARRLARRIWHVEREETRRRLRTSGVAVGRWRRRGTFDELIEEVEQWRRHLRRARV